MLPFNNDAKKLEDYVLKFYESKPEKLHYSGPVPVSMATTEKSHKSIQDMFQIVQDAYQASTDKNMKKFMSIRNGLMKKIQPFKQEMMDCIWASTTPQGGEKCADDFIRRVRTEGFHIAQKMADNI